jgi:hypothetical protein
MLEIFQYQTVPLFYHKLMLQRRRAARPNSQSTKIERFK